MHFADILLQNIALGKGHVLRDPLMTENTLWILAQEETRGNGCIFITEHNGHIERHHNYGKDGKFMDALLANRLGDAYFAIGNDFYKAQVNIPKLTNREREASNLLGHQRKFVLYVALPTQPYPSQILLAISFSSRHCPRAIAIFSL